MASPAYWKLSPGFLHPLKGGKHAPFLAYYERIHTYEEWVTLGFEIGLDKQGRITQKKGKTLHHFSRVWGRGATEQEAIDTGTRHVTHFYPMLDYVRLGVPFDDFVSHPQHYRDFCLASLEEEQGRIDVAIDGFRNALEAAPDEVRYAERFYQLRVECGDVSAPAQELDYFANEVSSMIHSERVYAWTKLLLSNKQHAAAAGILRRTAQLLEDKVAGRLPKGRYSGEEASFVAYKRDQFRKKLASWAGSTKYAPLMAEIERQGGLPSIP